MPLLGLKKITGEGGTCQRMGKSARVDRKKRACNLSTKANKKISTPRTIRKNSHHHKKDRNLLMTW